MSEKYFCLICGHRFDEADRSENTGGYYCPKCGHDRILHASIKDKPDVINALRDWLDSWHPASDPPENSRHVLLARETARIGAPLSPTELILLENALTIAEQRIAELEAQIDTHTRIVAIDVETASLTVQNEAIQTLTEILYQHNVNLGMVNYAESRVEVTGNAKGGTEPWVLTLQRYNGKTPHELRVEAEKRIAELEAALKRQEIELRECEAFWKAQKTTKESR